MLIFLARREQCVDCNINKDLLLHTAWVDMIRGDVFKVKPKASVYFDLETYDYVTKAANKLG